MTNEAKKVLERIIDTNTSAIIQKLLNELKDRVQKQKERLEENIALSMEKINCEELEKIKKMIDDYVKKDKRDKEGKRPIVEECMKIDREQIIIQISDVLRSLNKVKEEKNKLASAIRRTINTVVNELKGEPVIRDILELQDVKDVVDKFAGVLVTLATWIMDYFYGVIALAKLHLIIISFLLAFKV